MGKRNKCENCDIMYLNAGPGQWCLACDAPLKDASPAEQKRVVAPVISVAPPVVPPTLTSEGRQTMNRLFEAVYGTCEG